MGKTYVDVVKYLIKANLEVNGIVEKPDIVGAIFGQTEGLLGDELDLRELQKSGRIGRIEVETNVRGGRCVGSVTIPSSLDMVETSILAAALEIVDRVGPCDAKIAVQRIEDTRNLKRKQVLGRARDLLRTMVTSEIPESKELSEMVREEMKISEVVAYGPEGLAAGPGIDNGPDIVVVEGRADVLNLLRNGIKNVIAVGGANVGKTIADLCRKKEVTVFLDGDRGGDIILRELLNATEIEFVSRAPAGHEVEDLSRKELIQCLRRKVPTEQAVVQMDAGTSYSQSQRAPIEQRVFAGREGGAPTTREGSPQFRDGGRDGGPQFREGRDERRGRFEHRRERTDRMDSRVQQLVEQIQPAGGMAQSQQPVGNGMPQLQHGHAGMQQPAGMQAPNQAGSPMQAPIEPPMPAEPEVPSEIAAPLRSALKELGGSLKARFLGADGSALNEVPIRDIIAALGEAQGVNGVVLDGIVTQRLLDLCESKGVKFVCGIRAGNITRKPPGIGIVTGEGA
ncbi:DNA primase [Candidatus Micrarchaeota archaeon]|nr:DNA primase [Candidatus Micrarchaeota archaeon]